MVVQGGGEGEGGRGGHRAVIDGVFEAARRLGARDGQREDLEGGAGAGTSSRAFTGSSYTLSGDVNNSQGGGGPASEEVDANSGPVMHTITFYRNGIFTVDDGEPRNVQDPANKDFIDSIGRGEVPREFDVDELSDMLKHPRRAGGIGRPRHPVHVNLVNKHDEDYVPPAKPKYVAFAGQGLKLSGNTTTGSSEGVKAGAGASGSDPDPKAEEEAGKDKPFELDETQPVTSIQLRLMDGTRMVARFNPGTHTIRDVRRFLDLSRPGGFGGAGYHLVTAFPTTVLSEEDKTIEELGLKNAVILQKAREN
uniref:Uncharacterized protein n=1 Tax=Chloropicon laureae TaxID=464258 RepID=A0A7S3E2E3_9CHLO